MRAAPSARLRRASLLACAACLGCSTAPLREERSSRPVQPEEDATGAAATGERRGGASGGVARDASNAERLLARAVTDEDFARRVLYTWTTAEGARALRRDRVLLVADAGSPPGPSPFNLGLRAVVRSRARGRDVARLLLEREGFTKRRYAWTAPFATAVPLGQRSYGRVLVRVELRPESWIGRFEAGARDSPIVFMSLDGGTVRPAAVRAQPERIAAIYHVRLRAREPYREYVLCNESMVESWSLGTPEIATLVAEEQDLLRSLQQSLAVGESDQPRASEHWGRLAQDAGLEALWGASSAFDTDRHWPTWESLQAIIDALGEYDPAGGPLVHRPSSSAGIR